MASYWEDLKKGEFGLFGKQGPFSQTPGAALGYGRKEQPATPMSPNAPVTPEMMENQLTPSDIESTNDQSRWSKALFGTEGHVKRFPTMEKNVSALFNRLQPQLEQRLQQGLGGFGPIKNETERRFAERMPGIMERLNMISGGEQRGQAANQFVGSLSRDLESQLAAEESQYNLAQQPYLLNLLSQISQPRKESLYIPRQPGAIEQFMPHIFDILTKIGQSAVIPALKAYMGL